MANRILANVATPMQIAGRELGVTASVGVTRSRPGDTAESLLGDADLAMYEAKQRGRSRLQVYDRNMTARVRRNADIEQALRRAIRLQELRLHYQPIIDLRTGRVRSIEALARWERPDIGMVPPDVFIPIAEETGMILPIGEWVLRTACADLRRLRDRDPAHRDLTVNVNLSARQLNQTDIAGMVHDALQGNGLTGQALVLELTESALMGRDDAEVRALGALEALGVKLSTDDFGTGYSSLLYLKRFRVGQLKVDRQFVSGLGTGGEDDAIVRAIVGLAQALQIDVVAEGVETDRQIRHLTEAGCSIAQGYRLGRPVAVGQLDLTPVSLGRLTPREGTLP